MADPLRVHFGLAVSREFHQIDAATRRVHFLVPENVGWADRETESAVDALIDDFSRWRVMGVEGASEGQRAVLDRPSDATDEAAWVQRGFGIELLLYSAHERQRVAGIAPGVERGHGGRRVSDHHGPAHRFEFGAQRF